MGYTHGTKWDFTTIKDTLNFLVNKFALKTFPTVKQLDVLTGNKGLSNALCKRGGMYYWATIINLPMKKSETNFGKEYEEKCFNKLSSIGYKVEQMSTKFPYDLTANKHIKIDVKVGRLYTNPKIGSFYTFNLEKKNPTCDVFVCYCVNKEYEIDKVYIIPSKVMQGKKQLSLGQNSSIYDNYKNNWDLLKVYDNFYRHI